MLKRLMRNKKAQNTAEYAILISLVVAGIIAMQTYAQRALQSRVRGASHYLADQVQSADLDMGGNIQYEPYYLTSEYNVVRNETDLQLYDNVTISIATDSNRVREEGGYQEQGYGATWNLIEGI